MKKLVLIFMVALLVFSCKNETKALVKENKIAPELKVIMNFRSNKSDEFKLMLNNIFVDEFQKKNIQIIEKINASNKIDVIKASFGENNMSENFVIDLGNEEVKEVTIETITFTYGKNTVLINAADVPKHFRFNEFISFDQNTQKIKTQKIEGKHFPVLILKAKTLEILKNI